MPMAAFSALLALPLLALAGGASDGPPAAAGCPAAKGHLPAPAAVAAGCGQVPALEEAFEAGSASFLLQGAADRFVSRAGPGAAALAAPPRSSDAAAASSSAAAAAAAASAGPPAPGRLEKPVWLHIPKTGSGFETVLAHYVCGDDIPANVTVMQPSEFFKVFEEQCSQSRFGRFENLHAPIKDSMPLDKVVTMLREPRGRILSGYEYHLIYCFPLQLRYGCRDSIQDKPCAGDVLVKGNWVKNASVIDPLDFAQCLSHCTVNQLTGYDCIWPADPGNRIDEAVRRIDQLAFVGITDEWNMSVCLFHAKFGGRIYASEVAKERPGVEGRVGDEPVAHALISEAEERLKSWPATGEMQVYEAAKARFYREVELYQVDREACQQQIAEAVSRDPPAAEPLGVPPVLRPDAEGAFGDQDLAHETGHR